MEYLNETKEYTVVEFHNRFKEHLPQFVKVVQGYHGDRAEDVFDRDQVLCIQAVSRQQRVISKFKATTHQERLFSIPSTYFEKVCIVRQSKVEKKKFLFDILRDSRLPLTVCFPKDRTITDDEDSVSTNTIPNINLLQIFDEVHLLGNYINDGKMNTSVVYIPLYLSQLRLSLITGIKEQPQSEWRRFQEHVERASSCVEFDQQYGNLKILEYDPSAIHTAKATYTYVAPRRYTNMISLAQRLVVHNDREQKGHQTSRQLQPTHGGHIAQSHPQSTHDGYYTKLIKRECDPEYEEIENTSRLIQATPTVTPLNKVRQSKLDTGSYPINKNKIPALPQRRANKPLPKTPEDLLHDYSNDVPRTRIQPTVQTKQSSPQSQHLPTETSGQIISKGIGFTSNTNVSNRHEVSKLTINEVIACLNKLGLEQYEDTFRVQKIDGALLVELDTDMLKADLGMNGIEALKLTKFAKDGHIPV